MSRSMFTAGLTSLFLSGALQAQPPVPLGPPQEAPARPRYDPPPRGPRPVPAVRPVPVVRPVPSPLGVRTSYSPYFSTGRYGWGIAPYAYGYYGYGVNYPTYAFPFTTPIGSTDVPAPPLVGAGVGPITRMTLTGLPAELDIQFPAEATVWLNGQRVEGSADRTRTLSSPVLKPGTDYRFDVRAEWEADGKTFEYERTVTIPAGERSKITVLAGTPKS